MAYQNKYCTFLVDGVKSLKVQTTHKDKHNRLLTAVKWILQVPDLQHQPLFDQVTQVRHNAIELQFVHTKFCTASQWCKNALTHIARGLDVTYFPAVFDNPEYTRHELYTSDTWEPPTPPQLQFLPRPTNAWRDSFPKSITSTTASKADVKKTKTVNSTREVEDQQTITTAATQLSYSQDAINNLQSESRKHSLSIKINSEQFNCIKELVQTQIQQINTTVDAICNEQQSQIQQQ
jgi:hypothetical protein